MRCGHSGTALAEVPAHPKGSPAVDWNGVSYRSLYSRQALHCELVVAVSCGEVSRLLKQAPAGWLVWAVVLGVESKACRTFKFRIARPKMAEHKCPVNRE